VDNRTIGLLVGAIIAVVAVVFWIPATQTPEAPAPTDDPPDLSAWGVQEGELGDWQQGLAAKEVDPAAFDYEDFELLVRPVGTEKRLTSGERVAPGTKVELLMRTTERGYAALLLASEKRFQPLAPAKGDAVRVPGMVALQRVVRSLELSGEGFVHLVLMRCEEPFDVVALEEPMWAAMQKTGADGEPAKLRSDCEQVSTRLILEATP
jgi:hypothetical protein